VAAVKKLDPVAALRDALRVLSRAELEQAWAAAEVANKALGNANAALRAEAAAYLLASVLAELGNNTQLPDDLADILPAVESLALYVTGRMAVIVAETGTAPGNS
jgi:hypothetical protein